MHAHHKKFTQRFLANQPWKNPHGENQSERRDFNYFLQQSTGQKNSENTTYLHRQTSSQSLENLCSANQPTLFFVFCAKQMQMYSTSRPYTSLKNSAKNQAVQQTVQQSVPALNNPVPSSKSVQELNAPYSKNQQSVHPSKTVPNLMHRTAEVNSAVHPRKLCKNEAAVQQTVQQSVLLLGIRASKILNQSRPPCSLKNLFSNQSGKIVASSSKLDLLSFSSSLLLKNEK